MKSVLNFLLEVGKLKRKPRRGWELHKIKNPETTAEHIFHLAILVLILGRFKKINLDRALQLALIHDLCEVYAPDLTSFDAKAIKEKGRLTTKELLKIKPQLGRPLTIQRKKMERIKKSLENKAMKKLTAKLPPPLKEKIWRLWREYEDGLTREARFVKQADKMINFLQGIEYWKKYGKIQHVLWWRRIEEVIDDPELLELLKAIQKKFY
jgi:putative hydrolase of HD superfamily